MSENMPVQSNEESVVCPHCHRGVIGQIREVEGLEVLFIGNVPTETWKGFCPVCHKRFSWMINERRLESLIRRASTPLDV